MNTLAFPSPQLSDLDKGFQKISKAIFTTTSPTQESFENNLYYDEYEDERYTYGNWYLFPIKGAISPCNDWF